MVRDESHTQIYLRTRRHLFFFYFLKTKNYLAADLVRCRKKSSPKNLVLIRFFSPTILLERFFAQKVLMRELLVDFDNFDKDFNGNFSAAAAGSGVLIKRVLMCRKVHTLEMLLQRRTTAAI